MMKSSALFECEPLPPYVHFASTRRHSRDRCSQAFSVFRAASMYYTERKPKNKKWGRPGNEATLICEQKTKSLRTITNYEKVHVQFFQRSSACSG